MEGETDLQALERFVAENDDLLALEEQIGRFNIFDALGIARVEIRHSNYLAWLLTPGESHGEMDVGNVVQKAEKRLSEFLKQTASLPIAVGEIFPKSAP